MLGTKKYWGHNNGQNTVPAFRELNFDLKTDDPYIS